MKFLIYTIVASAVLLFFGLGPVLSGTLYYDDFESYDINDELNVVGTDKWYGSSGNTSPRITGVESYVGSQAIRNHEWQQFGNSMMTKSTSSFSGDFTISLWSYFHMGTSHSQAYNDIQLWDLNEAHSLSGWIRHNSYEDYIAVSLPTELGGITVLAEDVDKQWFNIIIDVRTETNEYRTSVVGASSTDWVPFTSDRESDDVALQLSSSNRQNNRGYFDAVQFITEPEFPEIPDGTEETPWGTVSEIERIRLRYLEYATTTTDYEAGFTVSARNWEYLTYGFICADLREQKADGYSHKECQTSNQVSFYNPFNPYEFTGLEPGNYQLYVGFATSTDGNLQNWKQYPLIVGEEYLLHRDIYQPLSLHDEEAIWGTISINIPLYGQVELDIMRPVRNFYYKFKEKFPFSWAFSLYDIILEETRASGEPGEPFQLSLTVPEAVASDEFSGLEIKLLNFNKAYDDYPEVLALFRLLIQYSIWIGISLYVFFSTKTIFNKL